MTDEKFNFLMDTLVSNFSVFRGVIANMRSAKSRRPYTICVSNTRNKNKLVPDECIVWDGDEVIYEGLLYSKKLKKVLDKADVCCMELTTAKQMESGKGEFICLGDYKTCSGKNCVCRSEAYWNKLVEKYPCLVEPEILITNPVLHNLVSKAFKEGWKVHKRHSASRAKATARKVLRK